MNTFYTTRIVSDCVARFGQLKGRENFFSQNGKQLCLIILLLFVSCAGSYAQGYADDALLASTANAANTTEVAHTSEEEAVAPRAVPATTHASVAMMTIKGRIIDVDRDPLVGATVFVQGTRIIAITDADGCYTLTVPTGAYTLRCGSAGYYDHEATARPTATDLTVVLQYRPDAFKHIKQR